ncbi:MAG: hypothetical protein EXR36_04560 [Betaproteobacteria bacterium]|nr:hypothetical protein [Betaproteobacteria bacterium]
MPALKEMDLGIEVVVALLAAAVLLVVAALGPKAAPTSVHPAAQFRTQLDLLVTPGTPARFGATQTAFGLSMQA